MSAAYGATECGAHSDAVHAAEHTAQIPVQELHPLKVKFVYKLINFICATISLSWFFEGWRQVNESLTFPHVALITAGTLLTMLFIGIHSYWVYVEEKQKGTLKKRFELFEKIHQASLKRKETIAASLECCEAGKPIQEKGEN